jgi:hypothetical protein
MAPPIAKPSRTVYKPPVFPFAELRYEPVRRSIALLLLLVTLFVGAFAAFNLQNTNSNANFNADSGPSDSGNPAVKVWVNKTSHSYHCPNSRYYGKTKSGEYMTQKDAQDAGNRPARGRLCN